MSEPHSLFLQVPEWRRWTGPLEELLGAIRHDAYQLAQDATEEDRAQDRDFAWRVLRRGAVVALRIRGDESFRREIRIARAEPLADRARWLLEVGIFVREFGLKMLDGSTPADERGRCFVEIPPTARDEGKTAIRLLELFEGETLPGAGRCYRCWNLKGEHVSVAYVVGQGVHQACTEHAWAALGDAVDEADRRKAGSHG